MRFIILEPKQCSSKFKTPEYTANKDALDPKNFRSCKVIKFEKNKNLSG